jgi:hypothetical protein
MVMTMYSNRPSVHSRPGRASINSGHVRSD